MQGHYGNWWGEVVNVYDPDQSGRVQVRIYGHNDDKENIPDSELHWALVMQPITSAAVGKIGQSPLGLLKSSKVMGYYADPDMQHPVVMGSFGKAGDPKPDGGNTDGIPDIDINTGSIPASATNASDPPFISPQSILNKARKTINDYNKGLADPNITKRTDGVEPRNEIDKKFKSSNLPTTASASLNAGHILDVIKQVDPSGKSASLPNMVGSLSNVRNMLNVTSPAGITNMLSGSLGNVIGTLGAQFGMGNILKQFGPVLLQGAAGNLSPQLFNAVRSGLTSALRAATANGGQPVAYAPPGIAVQGVNTAIPSPVYSSPPNLYVQQYYSIDADPYPGFIQWLGPNGDYVYTQRGTQPNFTSATQHVQYDSHQSMLSQLSTPLANGNLPTSKLISILNTELNSIGINGLSKVLGHGVSLSSIIGLAKKLLGPLGGQISGMMDNHLPKSVLDGDKVNNSMNKFTKNQSVLKKKKEEMKTAVTPTEQQKNADLNTAAQDYVAAAAPAAPAAAASVSENSVTASGNFQTITGESFAPVFSTGA